MEREDHGRAAMTRTGKADSNRPPAPARLLDLEPSITRLNSTNDYLIYGRVLNTDTAADLQPVVSVALEPAVWPYHVAQEEVYIQDVGRVADILVRYLKTV